MFNMGAVNGFDVLLDHPVEVYHPGETLTGRVVLSLTKDLAMKGIRASLKGETRTQWREKPVVNVTGDKRGSIVKGLETFLCIKRTLWGNEDEEDQKELPLLQAGQHTFPFEFILPDEDDLPCSLECGRVACVRYFVQATINISWAVDPLAEHYFSFIGSPIDPNLPKYQKPVLGSTKKSKGFCCRVVRPMALKVELQRTAYCPGEFVNIRTKLDNNSDSTMKLGVKLIQNVTTKAETPEQRVRNGSVDVMTYSSRSVLPDEEYVLQTASVVQIPVVPHTIQTRLIQVSYIIEVALFVDDKSELEVYFPITICNVPYRDKFGRTKEYTYAHPCSKSCGANEGFIKEYHNGQQVIQLRHFTPLYLTALPMEARATKSADIPIVINEQKPNGYAQNQNGGYPGSPRWDVIENRNSLNGTPLLDVPSLKVDEAEGSIIASKSSGSITKYNTRRSSAHTTRMSFQGNTVFQISLDDSSNASRQSSSADDKTCTPEEPSTPFSQPQPLRRPQNGGTVSKRSKSRTYTYRDNYGIRNNMATELSLESAINYGYVASSDLDESYAGSWNSFSESTYNSERHTRPSYRGFYDGDQLSTEAVARSNNLHEMYSMSRFTNGYQHSRSGSSGSYAVDTDAIDTEIIGDHDGRRKRHSDRRKKSFASHYV
ncbi:uncharacterized protein LOC117112105 [Anneissia japonica]|uniref:uncharacterized protein LOC117112105 n=1 Tax=Anneissia japonica TaxID=1529436 RepID=UPI0014257DC2|nr:uncharacterized protein LOC117112105 [Anneissia japonica]